VITTPPEQGKRSHLPSKPDVIAGTISASSGRLAVQLPIIEDHQHLGNNKFDIAACPPPTQ
jgi:hypothetical protein